MGAPQERVIGAIIVVMLASHGYAYAQLQSESLVSVELYYESLCPYSANFIVNYLDKLFTNGLISIVDLRLIPYGNAKLTSNNTISCQHGPVECFLNTIEACAINARPKVNDYFPFIFCVETFALKRELAGWDTCYKSTGFDMKLVNDCYESGLGEKLELEYAAETDSLQPSHTYVPWVVVNGQPLYEDVSMLLTWIIHSFGLQLGPFHSISTQQRRQLILFNMDSSSLSCSMGHFIKWRFISYWIWRLFHPLN